MSDDGEEGALFQVDEHDEFFRDCVKLSESEFLFTHNGITGLYKSTSKYLKKQDAYAFVEGKQLWSSNASPTGLPSNNVGSYIFMVHPTVFDSTKEVTHDWLRPWNSVALDGKRRVTPKWEKITLGDTNTFLRVSKSRHPRFPWIKRQVLFVSNSEGSPISNIFYQYVLEEKGDITQEEYLNQSNRANTSLVELPLTDNNTMSDASIKALEQFLNVEQSLSAVNEPSNLFQVTKIKAPTKVMEDCIQEIRSELAVWKRRYSLANGLAEMRRISEKCEQLTVLEEETSEAIMKLAAERMEMLRQISNTDEDGSPRKKSKPDSVFVKEED